MGVANLRVASVGPSDGVFDNARDVINSRAGRLILAATIGSLVYNSGIHAKSNSRFRTRGADLDSHRVSAGSRGTNLDPKTVSSARGVQPSHRDRDTHLRKEKEPTVSNQKPSVKQSSRSRLDRGPHGGAATTSRESGGSRATPKGTERTLTLPRSYAHRANLGDRSAHNSDQRQQTRTYQWPILKSDQYGWRTDSRNTHHKRQTSVGERQARLSNQSSETTARHPQYRFGKSDVRIYPFLPVYGITDTVEAGSSRGLLPSFRRNAHLK